MIRFHTDPHRRVRVAVFEGTVDDDELLATYAELLQQPDYDPTLNDLVDLRPVERLDVSAEAVRELAQFFSQVDELGLQTRLAIVAPPGLLFGMGRMYEGLRGSSPEVVQVFESYDQAVAWLGGGAGAG